MDADLDAVAPALYVTADDLLKQHPERLPPRPSVGFVPHIKDAELVTLAVMHALLGFTSERRWHFVRQWQSMAYMLEQLPPAKPRPTGRT